MLGEGAFHEATVEEVADRAGVARATLYQHFGSRLELVDAICDTFAVNPALVQLRDTVELEDPDQALAETIALSMKFWASEDQVLRQLYGVVAIDPAAADLVARQRADRRGELERLAKHLHARRRLPAGVTPRRALSTLLLLTSYETFCELREDGISEREATKLLQQTARDLLLA
jgi:AcrR family transcriptional regulator